MQKPNKKIYKNQGDVLKKFKKFIAPLFEKFKEIEKAILWGSLAREEFGLYEKEYNGHCGSDIDLIIFLRKNSKIPENWKDLGIHELWFNVYKDNSFRYFKYNKNIHKVDLIIIKNNKKKEAMKKLKDKIKILFLRK
ncbi:hypothetical protein CL621_02870 [archaeon]|nr:hypothetical protein [archaeon]